MKLKWSLRQVLLLVATVAIGLFIFRTHLPQPYFTFAFYLMLTSIAIVEAIRARGPLRAGFLGTSIFGIFYLVCVLKGGLEIKTYSGFQEFNQKTEMGLAFLSLAFLIAYLCAMFAWPSDKDIRDASKNGPR
jgi:hypothetical protein